jgi:hypothetical protein
MLEHEGSSWSDERFDHIIRHAEELEEKLQYIRQNPVTGGFVDHPDDYRWLVLRSITSQAEACGAKGGSRGERGICTEVDPIYATGRTLERSERRLRAR